MPSKDFKYNQKSGEIRNLFTCKAYNCSDDVDMQILCDDINLIIQNLYFEKEKANSKIDAIKGILE